MISRANLSISLEPQIFSLEAESRADSSYVNSFVVFNVPWIGDKEEARCNPDVVSYLEAVEKLEVKRSRFIPLSNSPW